MVIGADDLDDAGMAAFARWTNLSETTFLLQPTVPEADYRVRIFTPHGELPFAGHPTLGTCHVWLETGHAPKGEAVVQQCEAGLIAVRRNEDTLAFAAPPILRGGAVDPALVERLRQAFGLSPDVIADSAWVDNGPGWVALLVSSHEALLAALPDYSMIGGYKVGLAALTDADRTGASVEIRGFAPGYEDPATGHGVAACGPDYGHTGAGWQDMGRRQNRDACKRHGGVLSR